MRFPNINWNTLFSRLGFTRRELVRMGCLVAATSLASALTIPLEKASVPPQEPGPPIRLRERLELATALGLHFKELDALSKTTRKKSEISLARKRANDVADVINARFAKLRSEWVAQQASAVAAARWLLISQVSWAVVVFLVFVVVPILRRTATAAAIVPAVVAVVTLCWSFESGARLAVALAIAWLVIACIGKAINDNCRLRYKRPYWPKVALAALFVLPVLLILVGCGYWLGNQLEQYLARKVFETEAVLMLGVDAANAKLDEAASLKGNWWDPKEWFFYSFVRHSAESFGRPAVAETSKGISFFYSLLRTLYRFLQYLSAIGISWLLMRTTLFAVCRSFLYGGGAFMFKLPATGP
jgi:hypothetical protein